MKILLASEAWGNRSVLTGYLRSVASEKGWEDCTVQGVSLDSLTQNPLNQEVDVVIVEPVESPLTKAVMEVLQGWTSKPLILGYFADRKPYMRTTMQQLGAVDCLLVAPNRIGHPLEHVQFFREHLPAHEELSAVA